MGQKVSFEPYEVSVCPYFGAPGVEILLGRRAIPTFFNRREEPLRQNRN